MFTTSLTFDNVFEGLKSRGCPVCAFPQFVTCMPVGARQRPFGSASEVGSCVADLRAVVDKGKRYAAAAIGSGSSSS
jgi:hypothetical protein